MINGVATASENDLNVPDRFEGLREAGTGALRTIVVPVREALDVIDGRFTDYAGRAPWFVSDSQRGERCR